jgi:hypothetical protein
MLNYLRKILPVEIRKPIGFLIFKIKLKKVNIAHKSELKAVRKKVKNNEKIKIAFFVIHSSVWKYDKLFQLFLKDERFSPMIVICPVITYGEDTMRKELSLCIDFFSTKGYNYFNTLQDSGQWLDIKSSINPDIVFFTNPWNLTREEYRIENFLNKLTCYVPYGFKNSSLYEAHFNLNMQNFVWKFFIETPIHKELSIKYSRNKGKNAIVTGFPGMDSLLDNNISNDPWKIKDKNIKRIIWAPHHTIPGYGSNLDYSTFLIYSDLIFQIANELRGKVQFAFKPHPMLRSKLSKNDVWGKSKTDEYFSTWNQLENGVLIQSDYSDLFKTSDGLLHDSSSFNVEYLYTGKPIMFLLNSSDVLNKFNEFGKKALEHIYIGRNSNDISTFIHDVIIHKNDVKRDERLAFFHSCLKPPSGKNASSNIYNYISNKLIS